MRVPCAGLPALIAAVAASAFGQQFEVASIRPSPPLDSSSGPIYFGPKGGPGTADPGRYTCTFCNISELVSQAYDLPEYRVFSANRLPDGRFHVVASIPAGTTREQFRAMLRNFLADRFQLRAHQESREMQMYRLVTAPGGAKLKPHVEGAAVEAKSDSGTRGPGVYYQVQGKTAADFAKVIEGRLRKPVTDATGLDGKFDFDVWWGLDDLTSDGGPDAPTLLSVIRSLGLRLDGNKAPVEVVVIDEVNKTPTAN